MVRLAIQERILRDLDQLSPELQERAADLVHELVTLPPGTAGKGLLRFAGTLDDDSAREMVTAIESGCEQVDLDGWR